jgi:hypothetical protein
MDTRIGIGALTVAAWGALCLLACTSGVNGTGPIPDASSEDGPVGADGGTDAMEESPPVPDSGGDEDAPAVGCNASNCGGACCGNACVPRTCAGCAVGNVFCPFFALQGSNGTCVSDCSACQTSGAPENVTCYNCSRGAPAASCAAQSAQCPQDRDHGACLCGGNDGDGGEAGTCPGPMQVCTGTDGGDAGESVCITP